MTDHGFTPEQLNEAAQGNLNAFILVTVAYLKEQGRTPEEWVTFIGNRFAPDWESVKGQGAKEIMNLVVLSLVSAGGSLHSLTGDEAQAEAIIADWPPADALQYFGVTQEDFDPFYTIYAPIAAFLNLRFEWQRAGNQVTLRLSR